jgi:putative transcriptional regulator
LSDVVNKYAPKDIMIEIKIDKLLENRGRSFYWLAKETGISHTTLWRLKKGKALGINFETLERMCEALKCQPGDVLAHTNGKKIGTRQPPKRRAARSSK